MLKTALIIFLINVANPNEPARMLHKSFNSPESCTRASAYLRDLIPKPPKGVRVAMFCEKIVSLADENEI